MPRITFTVVKRGAVLDALNANAKDPTFVLRAIGAFVKARSAVAFQSQGRPRMSWKERVVPSILGIIADFWQGRKEPRPSRFEPRPVLQDTGAMGNNANTTFEVSGGNAVDVSNAMEYSGVHQFGGETESKPITEQVQRLLWRPAGEGGSLGWLQTKRGEPYQKDLGWLLNRNMRDQTVKGKVPARPFLEVLEEDEADLVELIGAEIGTAREGSGAA